MIQVHPDVQALYERVNQVIRQAGGRPLLVGGCVRDILLGLTPCDLDLEVYGLEATALVNALRHDFPVDLVGQDFGVLKIRHAPIDISLPRRESKRGLGHRGFEVFSDPWMSFQDAAARRDFTINAMGLDPVTDELLDPFGGQQDLAHRTLRHTSVHFDEDPLRVLRGMHFISRFGLTVVPETIALCRRLLPEYGSLAVERVWTEWEKWAGQATHPSLGLQFLHDTGWLGVYPELGGLQGCPQDPQWHPEGDVWTHTLYVVDEAARVAQRDGLTREERRLLALAALCHDLGKPATTAMIDGHVRSRGHTDCDRIVESFLQRLGAPKVVMTRIIALVRHHLSHTHFAGSPRHVRRLTRTLEESGETLRMLARLVEADASGRPPLPRQMPPSMQEMLTLAENLHVSEQGPRPLVLGRHLIVVGVPPGPMMGCLLKEAYDAQLDGEFETVESGLTWLKARGLLIASSGTTMDKEGSNGEALKS
jgi:tRNA nucleotidyltransferase (CCA-adding enzyme)